MNRLLIDTNIYSNALRGEKKIVTILQKANEIGIASISLGELLSGFKGGNKEQQNREELEEFLDSPRVAVYSVDESTAKKIKNSLQPSSCTLEIHPARV